MDHGKPQMKFECLKIAISMQQRMAALNTECRKKTVNRTADRYASVAQPSEILCRCDRKLRGPGLENWEAQQVFPKSLKLPILADTLKDLAERQAREPDLLSTNRRIEPIGFRVHLAV